MLRGGRLLNDRSCVQLGGVLCAHTVDLVEEKMIHLVWATDRASETMQTVRIYVFVVLLRLLATCQVRLPAQCTAFRELLGVEHLRGSESVHICLAIRALLHQTPSASLYLIHRIGNVGDVCTQPVIVGVLLARWWRSHSLGMVLCACRRGIIGTFDRSLACQLEQELLVGLPTNNHFLLVHTEV